MVIGNRAGIMVIGDWAKMPNRERCFEVRTLQPGHLALLKGGTCTASSTRRTRTSSCSCSAATTEPEGVMATTRAGVDRGTPVGAEAVAGGVTFRLWAPAAQQVFVLTGASLVNAQQPGFMP